MPGGLGSYSYNVARSFHALGYKVYILGISGRDETLETEFCTLVHVRSGLRKLASITAFIMMHRLVARIIELIGDADQDVVIYGAGIWGHVGNLVKRKCRNDRARIRTLAAYFTTFLHEYAGQVKGAPAADYGIFYALSLRCLMLVIRLFHVPKEHAALRAIDRIVVHYDSSRDILLGEIARLAPGKIVKTPYFIDSYERTGNAEGLAKNARPRIVCICRQDPRKGMYTLLHAVRLLRDRNRDFDCVIAGTGPFLAPNRRLAARLGIADIVFFPGFISSVEETLATADIYAFPSVEEGSGAISLLEAMKSGLPIVTTRCDGIPEDFTDGETGLLVSPGDAVDFADKLDRLLADSTLRGAMGVKVRADYESRFTLDRMTDGIRDLVASF